IAISDALALQQHGAYTDALKIAGLDVEALPPHPEHHDSVFIADTAIIWEKHGLMTRMNDVREGEQRDVESWLKSNGFETVHAPPGVRIEGGDVLHLDALHLVGRTRVPHD